MACIGEKAKWTHEQLHSSVHGDAAGPCWTDEERLVLQLAGELHDANSVSPLLCQQASEHYVAEQLIELIMLAGLYQTVSYMVNACGVQHESFAPKFPSAA